jgi:hypothetical protein
LTVCLFASFIYRSQAYLTSGLRYAIYLGSLHRTSIMYLKDTHYEKVHNDTHNRDITDDAYSIESMILSASLTSGSPSGYPSHTITQNSFQSSLPSSAPPSSPSYSPPSSSQSSSPSSSSPCPVTPIEDEPDERSISEQRGAGDQGKIRHQDIDSLLKRSLSKSIYKSYKQFINELDENYREDIRKSLATFLESFRKAYD